MDPLLLMVPIEGEEGVGCLEEFKVAAKRGILYEAKVCVEPCQAG